jgi:hypothetical protein
MSSPIEIPEILEHILLNLNIHDVLRATAVSRFWRDCIAETPSLQRLLFKRATPIVTGTDPHFHQLVEVHRRLPVSHARLMVEAFHQQLWRHLNRPTPSVTAEREDQYTQFLAEQWGLVDHYATICGDPFLCPGKSTVNCVERYTFGSSSETYILCYAFWRTPKSVSEEERLR